MPRSPLTTFDWVVIGSYFFALLAIGLYCRRFAGRSLDDFYLAGRRNSGWANGVSYAAAMMNADVAPAYSGVTVATGLFVCWWYLSRFGFALFLGGILFAVFWRRLNLFTTPEFYELRFGGVASNVIRSWVAVRSSLIAMVAWTGTGLLAMYKIAEPVLDIDKTTTFAIVIPLVLFYVVVSGFSGVVATAGVQSLIMFVGSAMLCGIVLHAMGGPAALATRVEAVGGPRMLEALPPRDHPVFPLAAALAWMVGTSIGYGGDTAPLGGAMEGQCVLSSRNAREASKMYLVAEITLFVLLLMVTLPSLAAIVDWPSLMHAKEADREKAYGLLMSRYLPPGMLGLLFVVMLAAVMSTIASNLVFGSQILVNDVYRRHLRANEPDRHYLWVGRAAAVLILALAILVAYRVKLIFDVAVFMVAASAAELPANWAQWWWWRFNRWGRISASFGGITLAALVWFVLPTRQWPWWDRTYLVIGLNTALWIVVTLITPPDAPDVLNRFYRRGRPLGAWGPVRRRLDPADPAVVGAPGFRAASGKTLIPAGLALAMLGALSVAMFVLGLSQLYVGRYDAAALHLGGFVLGTAGFLAGYGRYLDRLETWAPRDAGAASPSAGASGPTGTHPTTPAVASSPADTRHAASTRTIVALATVAYGVIIGAGGAIWTRGFDRTCNLIAAGLFLLCSLVVASAGRRLK